MNPLQPEPHALIQFALTLLIACFFAAVVCAWGA